VTADTNVVATGDIPGRPLLSGYGWVGRLRQARTAAGLTQVEVARRLGKTQSFVSKCESGERRVDVVELADLARLYRKPVTWFVR